MCIPNSVFGIGVEETVAIVFTTRAGDFFGANNVVQPITGSVKTVIPKKKKLENLIEIISFLFLLILVSSLRLETPE